MIFLSFINNAFSTDQLVNGFGTVELENIKINARRFLKEILTSSEFNDPMFKNKLSDFNSHYNEREDLFEEYVLDFIREKENTNFCNPFFLFLYRLGSESYKFIYKVSKYKFQDPDKTFSQIFGEGFKKTFTICKNIKLDGLPKTHVHEKILDNFFKNLDNKLLDQNCISTLDLNDFKCDLESITKNITIENGVKILTRSCDQSKDIPLTTNGKFEELSNYITTELNEAVVETSSWKFSDYWIYILVVGLVLFILLTSMGFICYKRISNKRKINKPYTPLSLTENRNADVREIP